MMSGDMDLNLDDIRVLLAMTNTTLDTDLDTDNLSGFTIDEMDGTSYARVALTNEAVNVDDANDRAEFDADDVSWATLGNGTRQVQGLLVFEFITNDAASFPLAWVEFTSTVNPGGSTLSVVFNAEGIVQLT